MASISPGFYKFVYNGAKILRTRDVDKNFVDIESEPTAVGIFAETLRGRYVEFTQSANIKYIEISMFSKNDRLFCYR